MTQPNYLPYHQPNPFDADASYLKTLSVLHYVWGGLTLLFSCFSIFYIGLGVMFLSGNPAITKAFNPTTGPAPMQALPPQMFGYMFLIMGVLILLLGWTFGILTLISGRKIAKRRSRVFSIVVGAINCISFPFGTALGVFTIIILSKDSVKKVYEATV